MNFMNLMKETMIIMDDKKQTIVLNNNNSDGFLDFYYSTDLDEVMNVLNKLMEDDDS